MKTELKLYTCVDHSIHWPVGGASIVLAVDETHARMLLDKELVSDGLKPHSKHNYTLKVVDLDKPAAIILCDGNY